MKNDQKNILLRVVTPGGTALEQKASSVVLRTATGEIQVLYGHAPIVVLLEPGELRAYDESGNERAFAAGEGFAEIDAEHVTVFSDLAEAAESISLEQAEEAKRRAETALAEAAKMTDDEREAADLALRESLVKIQMLLRRKDHKGGPAPLQ